jgi:PAS domain S-box-containing protein
MVGKLNEILKESLLETIPFEFSVIDENDKVVAWNRHDTRIFKRPAAVIGRDVRNCHPKKSLHLVEKLLEEMKSGERNKARFWIDLNVDDEDIPRKIMIEYYALRDKEGKYLGCVEATQDITEIQKLQGHKRLLD